MGDINNIFSDIPVNWKSTKLKYLGQLYSGLSGKSGNDFYDLEHPESRPYINFKNIAKNMVVNPEMFDVVKIKEGENQNNIAKNDLFFLMSSENYDDIGKTAILLKDVDNYYLNSFCKGFRLSTNNVYPTFLNYLLSANEYRKKLSIEANGYTRINLQIGKINDFEIYYPENITDQIRIAEFLDKKTAEIDTIIEKKEVLLLRMEEKKKAIINEAVTKGINKNASMKDSGIKWIGEIPEHWEVKPLGYLGSCQNGVSKGGDYFGEGYPFVNYGDIYKNDELPHQVEGLAQSSEEDRIAYSVLYGDIFFTRTSETIEEIGIASTCLKTIENAVFSGFTIRFRPNNLEELYPKFSKYLFRSNYVRISLVKEMNLVTRASLSQTLLKSLKVILPPYEEQKNIALYFENQFQIIDGAKEKIVYQIEKLKEYRQSLISEAVTGKIDI